MQTSTEVTQAYLQQYHKDSRLLLLLATFGLAVMIAGLSILAFLIFTGKPQAQYFGVNENRELFAPVPLDQPHINENALKNWANNVILSAFSFNGKDIDGLFARMKPHLNDTARKNYIEALKNTADIQNVIQNKLVVSVKPLNAPIIERFSVVNGRFTWMVSMRLMLSQEGVELLNRNRINLTLFISRVPPEEAESGLQIISFQAEKTIVYQ